eukprot:11205932-Lingulodinium_polyedra.AAC.2
MVCAAQPPERVITNARATFPRARCACVVARARATTRVLKQSRGRVVARSHHRVTILSRATQPRKFVIARSFRHTTTQTYKGVSACRAVIPSRSHNITQSREPRSRKPARAQNSYNCAIAQSCVTLPCVRVIAKACHHASAQLDPRATARSDKHAIAYLQPESHNHA